MKPNFEGMSIPELRNYVLSHRDDDEAIRTLFHHPSLSQKTFSRLYKKGQPIEENIRVAEEALRQKIEEDRKKQGERDSDQY